MSAYYRSLAQQAINAAKRHRGTPHAATFARMARQYNHQSIRCID